MLLCGGRRVCRPSSIPTLILHTVIVQTAQAVIPTVFLPGKSSKGSNIIISISASANMPCQDDEALPPTSLPVGVDTSSTIRPRQERRRNEITTTTTLTEDHTMKEVKPSNLPKPKKKKKTKETEANESPKSPKQASKSSPKKKKDKNKSKTLVEGKTEGYITENELLPTIPPFVNENDALSMKCWPSNSDDDEEKNLSETLITPSATTMNQNEACQNNNGTATRPTQIKMKPVEIKSDDKNKAVDGGGNFPWFSFCCACIVIIPFFLLTMVLGPCYLFIELISRCLCPHLYWRLRVTYWKGDDLKYAPDHIRSNRGIVIAAIRKQGIDTCVLEHAPEYMRNDRDIVMAAVENDGTALREASPELQRDKTVVMAAVQSSANALIYASPEFRNNKEIALIAVSKFPDAIKYVHEDLKHDPAVLIAAGMFDKSHQMTREVGDIKKIVLSTRFSLDNLSDSEATNFTSLLKQHKYIRAGGFKFYAPNAFDKKTCDPKWTDFDHPCRGTDDTCKYNNVLTDMGHPTDDCCWRYSFHSQLEEAKATGGFMLQLIEKDSGARRDESPKLGKGQQIERHMAQRLKMKIFHVYRPTLKLRDDNCYEGFFNARNIDQVASAVKSWYGNDCEDMSECVVQIAEKNERQL